MKFVKWIFSGEVIFSGFLFSSVFKGFFDNTFVDLTFVLMFLSILIAIGRLKKDPSITKKSLVMSSIYFSLGALMLTSLIYSTSSLYAGDKLLRFLSVTAWSFLGVFMLVRSRESLAKLLQGLLFFGLLTSLHTLYDYVTGELVYHNMRFGVDGENVLGLGRLTGITSIIIASMFFYSKNRDFRKLIIILIGFCITIAVLLLTGSRMPFISLLITLSLFVPLSSSLSKLGGIKISKRIFPFLSIMGVAFIAMFPLYLSGFFSTMFKRISSLFDQNGASVLGRTERINVAIDMWNDSPLFGKGVGSFSNFYNGMDIRSYPHNIFAEFASELGIVGLAFFVFLLLYSIVTILGISKIYLNQEQAVIILIFVYLLINANSTGDINDNRMLFTFISLTCMLPMYQNEINKTGIVEWIEPRVKKSYRIT